MTAAQIKEQIRLHPQPDVNGDLVTVMFEPMYQDQRKRWHYWCAAWKDGRCTIYHRRPKLCEDYTPLQDPLCWHHDETVHATLPPPRERGTVIDLLEREATSKYLKEPLAQ
jgi:Fe-S-cluster containining protein